MILIICVFCKTALRVTGDPRAVHSLVGRDSEFWPDKFTCYKCEKKAQGLIESEVAIKTPLDIKNVTPEEAYAALHGMGIMAERDIDVLILNELLRTQPVRRIIGKDIPGGNRVLVDQIELWDGTRLHLGSSSDGAIIYRVTKPHSYVENVKQLEQKA